MPKRTYTHVDAQGMKWRFDGSRPVSALADSIMDAEFSSKVWKHHNDKMKKKNKKLSKL
jgi:hypothetical protein